MQLDIDRELEICERATPGPWYAHNPDDQYCMNAYCVSTDRCEPEMEYGDEKRWLNEVVAFTLLQSPRVVGHAAKRWEHDADFIAAARLGYPDALRRLKRVRSLIFTDHGGIRAWTDADRNELKELLGVK